MHLCENFWELAERFIHLMQKESNCPVIVCNDQGVITRSTDRGRIGNIHDGARRIMAGETDELFVTADEAANNPLIKEGYSCPILIDGQRVGTFGLAGELSLVKPLARIATVVMASWVKELRQQEAIEATTRTLFSGADELATQNETIASRSGAMRKSMEKASREAMEKVGATDEILMTIQEISAKSNVLSINGAIEAARAGSYGRAFSVVVDEMRQMAKDTRSAATKIETTLREVTHAIASVSTTIEESTSVSNEQSRMVSEVATMIGSLEGSLEGLKKNFNAQV